MIIDKRFYIIYIFIIHPYASNSQSDFSDTTVSEDSTTINQEQSTESSASVYITSQSTESYSGNNLIPTSNMEDVRECVHIFII